MLQVICSDDLFMPWVNASQGSPGPLFGVMESGEAFSISLQSGVIGGTLTECNPGVISGALTECSLSLEQEVCLPLLELILEDKPEDVRTSPRLLNYGAREITEEGIHIYYAYNMGSDSLKFAEKHTQKFYCTH